jgi:hypothetical protein
MSWKDLTERLNSRCRDTFGDNQVIFKGADLAPITITAIFDKNYQQVDPDTGAPVSTNALMLGVVITDLPRHPKKDDVFNVEGVDHKVIDTQEDSEGMVKVLLHVSSRAPRRRS